MISRFFEPAQKRASTFAPLRWASQSVDLVQWRAATSWREHLQAISWSRAASLGLFFVLAAALAAFMLKPERVRAYPPPLPNEQTLEAREKSLSHFTSTPPQGLIDANQSRPDNSAR